MTKEEYEELLRSEYWKGYSYSLIKERNFTCEDCGRCFPNERNMLQVHHLLYKDVSPWSYKPDEVVVLCRECHQKRHGIVPTQETDVEEDVMSQPSEIIEETKPILPPIIRNTYKPSFTRNRRKRVRSYWSFRYGIKRKLIKLTILLFVLLMLISVINALTEPRKDAPIIPPVKQVEVTQPVIRKSKEATPLLANQQKEIFLFPIDTLCISAIKQPNKIQIEDTTVVTEMPKDEQSALVKEELVGKNHARIVKRAKRMGVSSEGGTLEILKRINHAEVVQQAVRAKVSTDGSTLDILERIYYADAVEQAELEGYNLEDAVLDSINHANVVEMAKLMKVSAEGATMDILERINQAQIIKEAKRAGVDIEDI